MPKRSLGVRRLTFVKKRDRSDDPEQFSPANLNGDNLLDLFERWIKGPDAVPHMDPKSDDCVMIKEVSRPNELSVLVDTNSGKRGEEGELYTPNSSISARHINEEDAPTGHTRVLLYVPESGRNALFFSEYCQRGTAGTRLIDLFSKWYINECPDIKMEKEFVREGEDWLQHIKAVKSIEMRAHRLPECTYEALQTKKGSFSLEFKPAKGQDFIRKALDGIRQRKNEANIAKSIFGIPELDGSGETSLLATVVGNDGRSKKINLADEVLPHFLRALSENGEPELNNEQFVQHCLDHASTIIERLEG